MITKKGQCLLLSYCSLFWFYLLISTTAFTVPCERGWTANNYSGTCIKLVNHKESQWSAARNICKVLHMADLVKIVDSNMNNLVAATLGSHPEAVFLGLKRSAPGQPFKWLGEFDEASYLNWQIGEPNDRGQACAVMNVRSSKRGKWSDVLCSELRHFICEKSTASLCPSEWIPSAPSGTCIRPHTRQSTWAQARDTCRRQGGDLALIETDSMNRFLADQVSAHAGHTYWIGLNNLKQQGKYQWLDYKDVVKYAKWNSGEPKKNKSRACVVINKGNKQAWEETDCSQSLRFICEKFSDCAKKQYGMFCPKRCSLHCPGTGVTCNQRTRVCTSSCEPGYKAPFCDDECDLGTYGMDCSKNCSLNCGGKTSACNKTNGLCLHGCKDGYLGYFCDKTCVNNTYGPKCLRNCSASCGGPANACRHVDGACTYGCDEGLTGPMCNKKAPSGASLLWIAAVTITIISIILSCFVLVVSLIGSRMRKTNTADRNTATTTTGTTITVLSELPKSEASRPRLSFFGMFRGPRLSSDLASRTGSVETEMTIESESSWS